MSCNCAIGQKFFDALPAEKVLCQSTAKFSTVYFFLWKDEYFKFMYTVYMKTSRIKIPTSYRKSGLLISDDYGAQDPRRKFLFLSASCSLIKEF